MKNKSISSLIYKLLVATKDKQTHAKKQSIEISPELYKKLISGVAK